MNEIILTFLKTFFPHIQDYAFHSTENFIYWGNKPLRMVLFTVASQDNGINSKQTKFNWPTNYKTYWYYMPFLKRASWEKLSLIFLSVTFHTMWSSDKELFFCLTGFGFGSDQTKCRHFYFLHPELVKATNMVNNMSNTSHLQWYAAHIYPTTTACQWHQLTVFMWNLPWFIEFVQYFCNKYMLPLGGSECHPDLKKKYYFSWVLT